MDAINKELLTDLAEEIAIKKKEVQDSRAVRRLRIVIVVIFAAGLVLTASSSKPREPTRAIKVNFIQTHQPCPDGITSEFNKNPICLGV